MDQITTFDVLIVYSERLATSANSLFEDVTAPFAKGSGNENYNLVYSYFLKTCRKNNLKAAFTTSADIVGAGKCQGYWLFENETWTKIRKTGFSKMIFDKFSPTSKRVKVSRNLLFSSKIVRAFNNPHLFNLCFDKQKTYNKLHKFSIPTVTIDDRTRKRVDKALKILKEKMVRHQHKDDFSEELIMKDRFGAGGINVYKFKASQSNMMIMSMKKHKKISFIIQPFIKFNKGFSYKNSLVSTDIRLIHLGNKIIQAYIRMAKKGDFRCNEHKGGLLKYIPKNEVPSKVVAVSRNIAKILNKKSSLFTLDFIISNNGNIYLLEANTGPGLDWNLSIKENEIEAKKLMRIIIKEIVRRISSSKNTSERKAVVATVNTSMISEYPVSPNILTKI
ncbi:MAG TPA: ATP-grasp domain-containing protein [Candidatus Bathyarchaeia archaeon]|nr:ATP-grasp domain-containing protein [Candidatus Bathyarchaeia archaeon]